MKSTVSDHSFVVPEALWAEVEATAVDEHRAIDDVLRDLIEHGLNERRWKARAAQEHDRARAIGLPDDDAALTDEYRRTIGAKITAGMASLRAGRSTDGESFMAAMDAELAELERQGHK